MSDVPPVIGSNIFGSQQSKSSEDEIINVSTLRKIVKQEIQLMIEKKLEVMVIRIFHRTLGPTIEDLIRPILKEQIELAVSKFLTSGQSNGENELHTSQPKRLTLQFRNDLSLPILTGKEIEGKGCDSIQVVLVDDLSGQVVESGPEASANIEIVVLKGSEGEGDNWTSEEFNNKIVAERKDKKPLLVGDKVFKLNRGTGVVGKIKFGHSSNWMKQDVFKLGARVLDTFSRTHIREAKTESFTVKDCRNEYSKKREIPVLTDEVWRLKNIARKKEIHKRLQEEQINFVEDFLVLLFKDPDRLKHIAGMKPESWGVTVKHARTCTIDKKMSCYADSQRKMVVSFNLVDQVLGVVSGCQYIPIEKLSENEKADAHKLAVDALENWKDLVSFDDEASVLRYYSSLNASVDPTCSRGLEHPRGQEASKMIGECSNNQLNVPSQDVFSSMNSAGGIPSEMHSVPQSINPFNMMDDQFHMEIYGALENSEDGLLFDNDTFHLYSSPSLYASLDRRSSQGLEHPRGHDIEASGMIGECSYANYTASSQYKIPSIDSAAVTPGEVHPGSLCINDFNMVADQPLPKHASLSPSPEHNQQIAATNMVLDGPRPSKRWVTLIHLLSLKRLARRIKRVTCEKLRVHLESDAFVVSKKRRVQ